MQEMDIWEQEVTGCIFLLTRWTLLMILVFHKEDGEKLII